MIQRLVLHPHTTEGEEVEEVKLEFDYPIPQHISYQVPLACIEIDLNVSSIYEIRGAKAALAYLERFFEE